MHRNELTRPRRCDAVVMAEDATDTTEAIPKHSCKKRVVKAGMCWEHYNKWVDAKEWNRVNVTRKKVIVLNGITYYSTIAIANKGEDAQPFASDIEQCIGRYGRCRRKPIINYEKNYYCQRCFMREQRRLAAKAKRVVIEQAAA